jgi:hypothetical protein
MSYLERLSIHSRSSLSHYVDKFVRKECDYVSNVFTDAQVNKIIREVKSKYRNIIDENDKLYELKVAFDDQEFMKDFKDYVIQYLNSRPSADRVSYYQSLCERYGLEDKQNINRERLEARISAIERSGGRSQEIKR